VLVLKTNIYRGVGSEQKIKIFIATVEKKKLAKISNRKYRIEYELQSGKLSNSTTC